MKEKIILVWQNNRRFMLFIALMMVFRSSFADWYHVPTGSMNPTITEGDRIFVNKMAYRFDLPFTDISLWETGSPARGDIVVFESKQADKRLVKRVIGLPGDTVLMNNNRLTVNSIPLNYSNTDNGNVSESSRFASYNIALSHNLQAIESFGPVKVPRGHYLVLGDNRNNSADSRYIGFIPESEVTGRAQAVLFSLSPDNYYLPRTDRFIRPLS